MELEVLRCHKFIRCSLRPRSRLPAAGWPRSRLACCSPAHASAKPRRSFGWGDQKGGAKSLMTASGLLAGIEHMIEWNIFAAAAPLLEALNAGRHRLCWRRRCPIRLRPCRRTHSLRMARVAAIFEHPSAVTDFRDEAQIRETCFAEAERFLKHVTGADRVFIFDHTLRHRSPGQQGLRRWSAPAGDPRACGSYGEFGSASGCTTCCRTKPTNC